jgi:hypothetical protein
MSAPRTRAQTLIRMRQIAARQAKAQLLGAAVARARLDAQAARLAAALGSLADPRGAASGQQLARTQGMAGRLTEACSALTSARDQAAIHERARAADLARREAHHDAAVARADAATRTAEMIKDRRAAAAPRMGRGTT